MDIVLKLRELRRIRNLTQKDVSDIAGVGTKTVSSFETGARIASMKISQLLRLLSAYDITPAEFFGGAIEQIVLSETEGLSPSELSLVTAFRTLPEAARDSIAERFLLMIDAAAIASQVRLRAI
jgi:transcriptional regulator with XRE-family HTH domain